MLHEEIIGIQSGETCNRDGCYGIISATEKEGSCSCHINPPCGYCTTQTEFCPVCGWSVEDASERKKTVLSGSARKHYEEESRKRQERQDEFWKLYRSNEVAGKFDYLAQSHTHFSMRKIGVFPPTMTKDQLIEKIKGTFGGRFTRLDVERGRFDYIAYTD